MPGYEHILLALDLTEESNDQLIQKAAELSQSKHCRLSIIHAVKPVGYSYDRGLTLGLLDNNMKKIQDEALSIAKNKLVSIATEHAIPLDRIHCNLGNPASEIMRVTKEINADLIILGSYCSDGTLRQIGSTAHRITDKAPCDTLVVRI